MRWRFLVIAAAVGALVLPSAGLASGSLQKRLNKTQWAAYVKQNTAFTQRTTKSIARFRYCLSSTTGSRNARAMQQCFGNTADLELTVTQSLNTLLRGFQIKVTGGCKTALGKYLGPLFFWQSTITGLKRAVHSNVANAATIEGSATQARHIYPQLTSAAKSFTAACKPLA
jgi:hypothetical protein